MGVLLLHVVHLNGQQSIPSFFADDTTLNKKRTIISTSVLGGGAAGSLSALSLVWYKNVPKSSFHFFNDGSAWLQMDKAGHVYSGQLMSNVAFDMLKWSGVNNKKATLIGGIYGFSYLTAFELMDGFAADWGFSWHDMGANAIGAGLFVGQSLLWNKQIFKLKFSAHLTSFAQYRPNLLGSNFPERILKDYNGQTYWVSFSPGQFLNESQFPKWLCFSLGYGAEGMIYGQENEPYIPIINGNSLQFDRYRTMALSLDIDLSEIPVKKPWLRRLLGVFNRVKVPFPALIWGNGKINGNWFYF